MRVERFINNLKARLEDNAADLDILKVEEIAVAESALIKTS